MLHLKIHTCFGAGFYLQKPVGIAIFLLLAGASHSQVKDTTLLDEVPVTTTKIRSSNTGKKTQNFDSLTLEMFKDQTLDVLLSFNTPIFIKNI
ncbi:MAG: hypothetical protein IPJ60_07275 [Sphingobacteriaceae bacterium]|nr:hypothetical protein [Sphingobacteriaceae bacterium]